MYDNSFYSNRHSETQYSAERMMSILLETYPTTRSAIDAGCGVGTFLSILYKKGITDILGVDGDWVNRDLLAIEPALFKNEDLTNPQSLNRKFDVAISLEVAEHLPPASAEKFVTWLCSLSDRVLFSAAIPGQGGEHHVNEAWPSYWIEIFKRNGFLHIDSIRPRIWNDERIFFWYRQNTFLFEKKEMHQQTTQVLPVDIVHPVLFTSYVNRPPVPPLMQRLKRGLLFWK